jgi:hypothetical protein
MGAFRKLLKRWGFVKLDDYGLVLTPEDRVLATRPAILDDGIGGPVVGWRASDLAASELESWSPGVANKRREISPVALGLPARIAEAPRPPVQFAPDPPPAAAPVPAAARQPAPAPTPFVAQAPVAVSPPPQEEEDWEWTIAAARARSIAEDQAERDAWDVPTPVRPAEPALVRATQPQPRGPAAHVLATPAPRGAAAPLPRFLAVGSSPRLGAAASAAVTSTTPGAPRRFPRATQPPAALAPRRAAAKQR